MPRSSTLPVLAAASAAAFALAAASGCTSDTSQPNPGVPPDTIIVNASASTAFILFGSPITQVYPATPTTSTGWELGVRPDLTIELNGGAAGPGGVTGYCLCENAGLTQAQVEAMTSGGQLSAFEVVNATQIPAANMFQADVVIPAVDSFYTGTPPSVTPSATHSWVIRYDPAGPRFAKMKITSITGSTMSSMGSVTFTYAVQTTVGGAFTADASQTVDATSAPVYFDFSTQAVGTSSAWSIEFTGYQILSNGGVSGTANVAGIISNDPYASIDATYVASIPSSVFSFDAFGGVFAAHSWYLYDSGTHLIWPRYETYFIMRGTTVYKVQVTGFYSGAGAPFNYTFRAVKLVN